MVLLNRKGDFTEEKEFLVNKIFHLKITNIPKDIFGDEDE